MESDFTTILVEPGDLALIDQFGGIELQISLNVPTQREGDGEEELDPITLAVVEHRLESIALEMTEVMLRTSMSQILNSSRDFSTTAGLRHRIPPPWDRSKRPGHFGIGLHHHLGGAW